MTKNARRVYTERQVAAVCAVQLQYAQRDIAQVSMRAGGREMEEVGSAASRR